MQTKVIRFMCGRKVYPIRTSLIRIKVICIGTRSNVDTPIISSVSDPDSHRSTWCGQLKTNSMQIRFTANGLSISVISPIGSQAGSDVLELTCMICILLFDWMNSRSVTWWWCNIYPIYTGQVLFTLGELYPRQTCQPRRGSRRGSSINTHPRRASFFIHMCYM